LIHSKPGATGTTAATPATSAVAVTTTPAATITKTTTAPTTAAPAPAPTVPAATVVKVVAGTPKINFLGKKIDSIISLLMLFDSKSFVVLCIQVETI
jgi:hypothetical protein